MAIGEAKTGAGFGGLTRYLLTGKDGNHPERVAWTGTRNLGSTRPEHAAARMGQVAARNTRVQKPVYHFSISWHADDRPTPEQMAYAADRVLHDLGLRHHQALLVAHRDTPNPHVHVVVNRVHPRTNKVWHNSHDWPRIEQSLRRLEREQGWRLVPESRAAITPAPPERREALRQAAREPMLQARTWASLEHQLQQRGLSLQARGRGLVVTDGDYSIKASEVDRSVSRARLEERFRMTYRDWRSDVREVRRLAVQHRNLTYRTPSIPVDLNPRRAHSRLRQLGHRARTVQQGLEGRGDPKVIERKLAAFGMRFGMTVLRRISPQAATIVWAARLARRALDRERSGRSR